MSAAPEHGRWRPLWILLACLVCQMGVGFFYASRALSASVLEDLGWTRTMWASAVGPMLIVSSIGQAFVGAACARVGVRPVVTAAVLCLGVSVVLFAGMETLLAFHAAMIVLALANAGLGDVSIGSVVTRWFAGRRSLALGVAMLGSNLGSIVFIAAIGAWLGEAGWRQAALVVGLGSVVILLPFALFVIRDPKEGEAPPDTGPLDAAGDEAPPIPYRTLLGDRSFQILFYALFCYSLVQLGLVDQLVLYLIDLGYEEAEAFRALQLTIGAGIAAKLGAGLLGQVVPPRWAFVGATLLLLVSLVLVPFAANGWVLTLFGLGFGLSTSSRDVLLPLLVSERFGSRDFARVYGLMALAWIPGGALGPLVLAETHRIFGHYRPGFLLCVGLVAMAALALGLLPRPTASVIESNAGGTRR